MTWHRGRRPRSSGCGTLSGSGSRAARCSCRTGRRTIEQQRKAWNAYQNGTGPRGVPIGSPLMCGALPWTGGVSVGIAGGGERRERPRELVARELRPVRLRRGRVTGFSRPEPWHYEYQGNPWDGSALAAMTSTEAETLSPCSSESMTTNQSRRSGSPSWSASSSGFRDAGRTEVRARREGPGAGHEPGDAHPDPGGREGDGPDAGLLFGRWRPGRHRVHVRQIRWT